MHNPSKSHMEAMIRILWYLKSSLDKGFMFSKHDNQLKVDGYTNADWAGNIPNKKSTSGYFKFVGRNLVIWRSNKQKVVALSSAEAEFRGMPKGIWELLWLKSYSLKLDLPPFPRWISFVIIKQLFPFSTILSNMIDVNMWR